MVGFDVPFAFVSAGAIGWRGGSRGLAMTYVGLGVVVPGTYFLEAFPAWDTHYLFEVGDLPTGFFAGFLAAVLLAGWLGHRFAASRPGLIVGGLVVMALLMVCTWHQTLHVGSLAEYQAGQAPLLPLPWILSLVAVGLPSVLGLAWSLFRADR